MGLYIQNVDGKGRGVFTNAFIGNEDIIEVCQLLIVPEHQRSRLDDIVLRDYYFAWGKEGKEAAIAFGNGSLYNHSYSPNARYVKTREKTIMFLAIKDIPKWTEITVNYNGTPHDKTAVWFDVKE